MARKPNKPLTRPGEPVQYTPGGLEIPVPTRDEFFKPLRQATEKAPKPKPGPSQSAP